MSDHDEDDWGNLPFKILAVHKDRTPAREPPFHTEGGEWFFLDCRAGDENPALFTVGVLTGGKDDRPMVWGKAWLAVADREAGARLVCLFADAFFEDEPPHAEPRRPLEPLLVRTANLDDLRRHLGEGGVLPPDAWSSTKWFLELGRFSAEVYFNYNLGLMRGEFAEKDPDYREDLLGVLATALRDGKPPPRTPETDPNLTESGPRVAEVRAVQDRRSSHHVFTPGGRFLVYQDGNALLAVPPASPDDSVELARFEHLLWDVVPVDDEPTLLVVEDVPDEPGRMSAEDPLRIWWVGGGEKRLLRGPERWLGLGEEPASSDRRHVTLTQGKNRTDSRLRYTTVLLIDRETMKVTAIDVPNRSLTPVGWRDGGSSPRALLMTNRWGHGDGEEREAFLADPATGVLTPDPEAAATLARLRGVVSPDGKYLAEVQDEERLVLTELATGRRREFVFHEDDLLFVHEECVEWINSRFLQFHGRRPALIDATGLKMSFPMPQDGEGESSNHRFSPDLAWVAFERETLDGVGLYLGRVASLPA